MLRCVVARCVAARRGALRRVALRGVALRCEVLCCAVSRRVCVCARVVVALCGRASRCDTLWRGVATHCGRGRCVVWLRCATCCDVECGVALACALNATRIALRDYVARCAALRSVAPFCVLARCGALCTCALRCIVMCGVALC